MVLLVSSGSVQAADATQHSRQFFVITFEKGAAWVDDRRYEHQPGIDAHLEYWKVLYYQEILLMIGPLQDQSGGIFIVRASDESAVDAIVERDPAVIGPDESFRLERLDPDSPINLRNN